ncbi:chemotaxis protein CheB [Sphingomonas sp. Leaf339]|uniref:chemotaxis protein CheB n=1 Tax=Sphingomonas sp. Leaf339 TaxID=1736343 RepID=UPI0006F8D643|nr:chemotaxis protein CheB [Sphingomonas sp. Leaf339]KQU62303.1 chemotaxis protein CheB [Sphingomonas sp. Leaf339]
MALAPLIEAALAVRVLIVDDSVVARVVLTRLVQADGRFVVAAAVGTIAAALQFLSEETVDIILLDVALPGVDGLTALPDMLAAGRGARIVIVSSSAGDGAATTIQALALGAADTLEKPDASGLSSDFGRRLVDRLSRLSDRSTLGRTPTPPPIAVTPVAPPPRTAGDAYDIVAIGASTGGIHALGQMLRALPPTFRLPVLVTQHLPASFMPYFAAQLALMAGRPCDVATDRLRIRPGRLIVAPGDAHLRCVSLGDGNAAVRLNTDPAVSGCLPSVDPMLSSLAEVFGRRLMAVVLSGMGRDGAEGARRVRAAGGCVVVQDQASSVVWGMPGAIAMQGLADAVLPPDAIGRLIATRRRP